MRERWALATGLVALGCVAVAVALAVLGVSVDVTEALVALAAVVGIGGALWQLYRARGSADGPRERATTADSVSPEQPRESAALSGTELATLLAQARERARENRDVAAGLEVVRPTLRRTLGSALSERGFDDETIRTRMAEGTWTDDPVAAAVLDESVPLPTLPLRDRVTVWLFPQRVLGEFVGRAVEAVADRADAALPSVPGQDAPRPVPVRQPTLSELRQGVDGDPQTTATPFEAASAEGPPAEIRDGRAVHERLGVIEEESE